jgi:uncharacterized protein (DUF2141 family)
MLARLAMLEIWHGLQISGLLKLREMMMIKTIKVALVDKSQGIATRLCLIVMLLVPSFVQAQASIAPESTELVVRINNLRNDTGMLGCQVFSGAKGFPNDSDKATAGFYVPIKAGAALCKFGGLAAGQYAVTVMHDENNNKVLDTNVLGIPKEGYGVSNNKTYAMSQPKWDESRFDIAAGEKKVIAITLRY